MKNPKKDIALVLLGATLGFGGGATVISVGSPTPPAPVVGAMERDGGPPYLGADGVFYVDPPEAK